MHKLAVSQLPETGSQAKNKKDINQACALMRVLLEDNPGELDAAFEAVIKRDDQMDVFVRKGFTLLPEEVKAMAKQVCGSVAKIEKAKISPKR